MDPNARLDHALFQLTPTRTRCDLLIFAGVTSEKLASGLLDPFLSHLRCAKNQIPRGGYSITLRPDPSSHPCPWFTKATLQRFVRFVSTPEILERFATIEKEIAHIESSIQLNDLSAVTVPNATAAGKIEEGNAAIDGVAKKSMVPFKVKGQSDGDDAVKEENSRLRLQRVLETRKAVLRKEQAMAYARAIVAGFEENEIDDLIAFADAFGASRLREACINFKDLCKKKHGDGLWMDELAAIEACPEADLSYVGTSGIILAGQPSIDQANMLRVKLNDISNGKFEPIASSEASTTNSMINHGNSNISEDDNVPPLSQTPPMAGHVDSFHGKTQVPMTWPNPPPYMFNFQGPGAPQMHPYQGYPFPGMHTVPMYYPGHSGNMQLPPHMEDLSNSGSHRPDRHRHRKKPSRKKGNSTNGEGAETTEVTTAHSGSSDSCSCNESDGEQDFSSDVNPSTGKSQKKRSSKKSSRMVVIRNINYISKTRDGDNGISSESLDEDDFIDGDSIKQKVEDVVESLQINQKSNQHHSKRRNGRKHSGDASISNVIEQFAETNPSETVYEGEKRDGHWQAFQNILMRDEEVGSNEMKYGVSGGTANGNDQNLVIAHDEYCAATSTKSTQPSSNSYTFDAESKKGRNLQLVASDSFVITEREMNTDDAGHLEKFQYDENYCRSSKRSDCTDGDILLPSRRESASKASDDLADYIRESSSAPRSQRDGDWFIVAHEKSAVGEAHAECSMFDGDQSLRTSDERSHADRSKHDFMIDDSFVFPSRNFVDQSDSQWRTDISMVAGLEPLGQQENFMSDHSKDKHVMSEMTEPDDLYMVLERNPGFESAGASWTPDIDYSIDISFIGADRKDSGAEVNGTIDSVDNSASQGKSSSKKEGIPRTKRASKDDRPKPLHGYLAKSRSESIARTKRATATSQEALQKIKLEKEEENRRKKEELLIQRQKRIAERSGGSSASPATSKSVKPETKIETLPLKSCKQISRPPIQEVKRLSLQKTDVASPAKERPTVVQAKNKASIQSKSSQSKSITKRGDGVAPKGFSVEDAAQTNLSNPSAKKSSTADQMSVHFASVGIEENLSNGEIVSSVDNFTNVAERRNSAATNGHGNSLDVSDNKEACNGQEEILDRNVAERNDSFLAHESSLAFEGSKPEEKSHIDTSNNKISSEDFVDSSQPIKHLLAGLDSFKELEVDKSVSVPADAPKISPLSQEERTGKYTPPSVANKCTNDDDSPHYQIPTNFETNVNSLSVENFLNSSSSSVENVNGSLINSPVKSEISEIEIISDSIKTTPPPINGLNSEPPYSRKKWSNTDGHPATKGIKKLLIFGRKSRNSAAC